MSKFSGKCDFCDEIAIHGLDHILRCDVYVGSSRTPLRLTCLADCVPYYPYIVSVAAHDNVRNRGVICLTERSWVDIEEERDGHHPIHDYYRQALAEELAKIGKEAPYV